MYLGIQGNTLLGKLLQILRTGSLVISASTSFNISATIGFFDCSPSMGTQTFYGLVFPRHIKIDTLTSPAAHIWAHLPIMAFFALTLWHTLS
jgi:hypothetical protein